MLRDVVADDAVKFLAEQRAARGFRGAAFLVDLAGEFVLVDGLQVVGDEPQHVLFGYAQHIVDKIIK